MVLDNLSTLEELRAVAQANDLMLLDFTAQYCGPCRMLTPKLEQFQETYPMVKFYKVDTQKADQEFLERFQIQAMPTVFLLKDGAVVSQVVGLQVARIKEELEKLVNEFDEESD